MISTEYRSLWIRRHRGKWLADVEETHEQTCWWPPWKVDRTVTCGQAFGDIGWIWVPDGRSVPGYLAHALEKRVRAQDLKELWDA